MQYALHLVCLVCLYGVLAESLSLLMGQAGRLSLAHAVFFGIGAYCLAVFTTRASFPFFVALGLVVVVTSAAAAALAQLTRRFESEYFVLVTFAVQLAFSAILINARGLSGGPIGIAGIPSPELPGFGVGSRGAWAVLWVTFWSVSAGVLLAVRQSPLGRLMRSVRDDPLRAVTLGKDVVRARTTALVLTASLAGMSGGLYAGYTSYISPSSFDVQFSLVLVAMVVIGGSSRVGGGTAGAAVFVFIPEVLRSLGVGGGRSAEIRQIVFGLILILVVISTRRRTREKGRAAS